MSTEGLLRDMADWLESESIGLNHGAQVFSGVLPDVETPAVALIEYGAGPAVWFMDPEDGQPAAQRALVQCLCKNSNYDAARATAHAAHAAILRMSGQLWQSVRIVNINPIQSRPFYVGDDADGDPMFSCNYEVEVEAI